MNQINQQVYEFSNFRLEVSKRTLLRDGTVVPLAPKAFDVLVVLVEHHGEVLEKDRLMTMLWPDSIVEEANLPQNISALRKALGESPYERKYIVTIPGKGYKFAAEVKVLQSAEEIVVLERHAKAIITVQEQECDEEESIEKIFRSESSPSQPRQPTTISWPVLLGLMVTVPAALVFLLFRQAPAPSRNAIQSIAVLPFEIVDAESGNPELEYLSDGISENLINNLSKVGSLKVIARSSTFQYKGKDTAPEEIGKTLGVETILTGRVLQLGEKLQVSVELMDVRDRTIIWGDHYHRPVTDLLAVQAEISSSITDKLRLHLTVDEKTQLAKRETVNPAANEMVFRGRFIFHKGGTENRNKAIDYFNQAISLDPEYAPAYAYLSATYSDLISSSLLPPQEFATKAESAARKAMELDEGLAEAHLAMAYIKRTAWDWAAADQEYRRAIELNPNFAIAHLKYSSFLSLVGQHELAIAESKRALSLDPLTPGANLGIGLSLLFARRYNEAFGFFKLALELSPHHPAPHQNLGNFYYVKGMYAEATAAYNEAIKLGGDNPSLQIYLGAAYALSGARAKAQVILKRLHASEGYVSPGELAVLYIALGEREQAFVSLEKAFAVHDMQLQFLGLDPAFDPLRSDPRFQKLVHQVGLDAFPP